MLIKCITDDQDGGKLSKLVIVYEQAPWRFLENYRLGIGIAYIKGVVTGTRVYKELNYRGKGSTI